MRHPSLTQIFMPRLSHPLTRHLALVSLLLLAACGGGGGGGSGASSGGSASSAASISGSSSSKTSSASSATSSAAASSFASSAASSASSTSLASSSLASSVSSGIYVTAPTVSSCSTGQLKDSERTAVLAKLNAVRTRHGLSAVTYDSSFDTAAAEAAMYMVANKGLTHSPSNSGLCYTSGASTLAGSSNLHLSWTSASTTQNIASSDAIVGYLIDDNVASLGHRRWVLYPFLSKTTYGRVDGQPAGTSNKYMASVLKVIGNAASSVSMTNDFVAYPYGSYPASEFSTSWFLSFSVVASKTNANANGNSQVSFASASISVKKPDGTALTISEQSADYTGYGLPNHLQWKAAGLQNGVSYTVTISNVVVNGVTREFVYSFSLQ
jgi:uncharacterized protein YkwD